MSQQTKTKLVLMVHEGGTQSNLKAIRNAIEKSKINAEISAVISDTEEAMSIVNKISPDYICLAGWKKIIPNEMIKKYENKILNLHPGLIPDKMDEKILNPDNTKALWNKGMYGDKAISNFFEQKSTFAGSSIHFLTLNFDFGPVLGRTFEKIKVGDTVESLYTRLKKKENELYVEVLEKITSPQSSPYRRGRKGKVQKILIIGSGGREHAIGWKVAQSERAGQIFFAPGNAGTSKIGTNLDIKATEIKKLIEFAKKDKIDLTLALPDDPLALGIVDEFQKASLRIWGPTKAASQLEWSKAYAKDFMKRHKIPTAKYKIFSDFQKAKKYVEKHTLPIVVKASGLALGKGVTVAQTKEEAIKILEQILVNKIFGNSGNEVVIEEYLVGTEISIHAISDGESWKIFPASQDHKRVFAGNTGPNTGGMGVIAPLPFVDKTLLQKIEKEIIGPTIIGMKKEGRPFVGILYPGIMLTKEGPKVFEFNARFGDPETQTYMRLLNTDILDIIDASIDGKISDLDIQWQKNIYACNIALASAGYPGNYEKRKVILGIAEAEMQSDIIIFHAGTKIMKQDFITNGGRVLGISATGNTLEKTLKKAYKAIEKISFEGMQYRKDIGENPLKY